MIPVKQAVSGVVIIIPINGLATEVFIPNRDLIALANGLIKAHREE